MKSIDLNTVEGAREFLTKALPEAMELVGKGSIDRVVLKSGRELMIKDMNDSEALQYALELLPIFQAALQYALELLPIFQAAFPEQVNIQHEH